MPLQPEQRLAHYRIVKKIGAGGMGEVYRAEDTRLGRIVALKVLPHDATSNPEKLQRFRREARTVAALNHPNIVTLFSVEQADDVHFITMELVEGRDVDSLLPSSGLSVTELLDLAIPLAEALAAAHDRGIVHRDLKPANVMVSDDGGRVKVLDFGLAKMLPGEPEADSGSTGSTAPTATAQHTRAGSILGTQPYMSPEQARGEPVDSRSDIFSFGVMLFEMITGERPFRGKAGIELLAAVIKDPAPDLGSVKPDLPRHLEQIIARCLQKAPPDRFQTASEVLDELRLLQRSMQAPTAAEIAREPATATRAAAPSVRRPFVGRDEERTELDLLLDQAIRGRGSLVMLGGEPGVGKTRLATEILEDGRERGMLALTGHAYEDQTVPFVTASEILEEMIRLLPADTLRRMLGVNAAEIARLLPELRQAYPDIPQPVDTPPEMQQRFLFKSVTEFLARAASETPMVILLDDIHWADESSLLLLEHIAPQLPDLPILMLGTYRDVEADVGPAFVRTLATLVRRRLGRRMPVKPFRESAVADLLAALGGESPPPDLVAAIHRDTEGNVFFVEELFHHLSEEGLLIDEDGCWREGVDVEQLDVPEGVRLVTGRRLDRLHEETQKALTVASVMGLRFRLSILAPATGVESVADAVEEAEAAHLIRPAATGRDLRYEFVHGLARQTLQSRLSEPRRRRLHLQIADAIEAVDVKRLAGQAADLAHHLVEAGAEADARRTVRWLQAAGDNAAAAAAMDEAVQAFDTALSLADDLDREEQANLLHRRGSARLSLGHREEFSSDLREALEHFEALGLGDKAAAVVSELAYMLAWWGRPQDAEVFIARALALVGNRQSVSRCRLLSAQGSAHSMAGKAGDAEDAHDAAVDMARTLREPALLAEVLQNHGLDRWQRLDGVSLARSGREAASLYRELKQEWNLSHCLWMEQAGLVFQGRFDAAEQVNQELHALARRHEDVGSLAISRIMNSVIEQARGNIEESSRHMRRSIELFDEGTFPWGRYSEGHYSVNALLVGEYQKARTAFEIAGTDPLLGLSWSDCDTCYWLSGKARLGDTDTDSAFESLRSRLPAAGTPTRSGAVQLLVGSIEALALLGRNQEAAALYPAVKSFVDSGFGVVAFTYGLHERFAGVAATAAGDWEAAETHFREALRLAEELPHRVDQARVRYWYARMLLARGEKEDAGNARQALQDAAQLARDMGLYGLLEQIDAVTGD